MLKNLKQFYSKRASIFTITIVIIFLFLFVSPICNSAVALRSTYIYDSANILDPYYKSVIERYLSEVDEATSAEIVIYTIPSFIGHGITKDGHEINDRDTLANNLFNKVPLDGIIGIGKQGKDNGVLLLYSLKSDSGGGSMRIEVGRGLEGNITDGTAGEILDSYLVPAREIYQTTGNKTALEVALLNTVIALGQLTGYSSNNSTYQQDKPLNRGNEDSSWVIIPLLVFAVIFALTFLRRRRRWGGWYGGPIGWGTGWSGGSSSSGGFGSSGGGGGGGGSSAGGGAGR